MYHRLAPVAQSNPLLPGYPFSAWLVAGLTPINAAGPLDFFIDRPHGMKGYILNLTIKGRGRVFDGEAAFDCEPGDLLLFQPKTPHYYGRLPDSDCWYHRWVYFRPAPTGATGWSGRMKRRAWGACACRSRCAGSLTACLPILNTRITPAVRLLKNWR